MQEENKKQGKEKELYEWVQALVSSVLVVVLIFTFVIRLIGVDGHSMLPTLQHGDRLLVLNSALCGEYEYGDIVIVRKDTFMHQPIVKRVIATEGQTVDIDFTTGSVWVDDQLLDEPYINELTFTYEGMDFPVTLREGEVFVMGDNRNASDDSRDPKLGPVDERYIIGKAVVLAFPGEDIYTKQRAYSRIGVIG